MGPILRQHLGEVEGDMVAAPVVLEVINDQFESFHDGYCL